jgi:hypothetical protein
MAFPVHLEAAVEREVKKFIAKLKRAHERRARRARGQPSNQRVKPAAVTGRDKIIAPSRRRGLRAGR